MSNKLLTTRQTIDRALRLYMTDEIYSINDYLSDFDIQLDEEVIKEMIGGTETIRVITSMPDELIDQAAMEITYDN